MMLGYQASASENAYDFFFLGFFFFQSDRPTQYQKTHSTVNRKKKGDGLITIVGKRIVRNVFLWIFSTVQHFFLEFEWQQIIL